MSRAVSFESSAQATEFKELLQLSTLCDPLGHNPLACAKVKKLSDEANSDKAASAFQGGLVQCTPLIHTFKCESDPMAGNTCKPRASVIFLNALKSLTALFKLSV